MKSKRAKVIAFYLPQFHPIPENDKWWGKGFTEWTNVGKAKRYYPGHYQPRVPADLGYYDLRVPEVREKQAELAKEAGIEAFCYWHYWFGNGKQLLEMPLQEVIETGKPDFPFCLGWANHDWSKKNWNSDVKRYNNEFLVKQIYPGEEDIEQHFNKMLPAFKDQRYFKVHDKLLFYIYSIESIPDPAFFMGKWNKLAEDNNLPGFYFVANCNDPGKVNKIPYSLCNGVNLDLKQKAFLGRGKWWRRFSYLIPFPINVVRYSKAIERWKHPILKELKVYPTLIPNWDHSPRLGVTATILHGSNPSLFFDHATDVLSQIDDKEGDDKLVFLKSWNEWAEGNYMEPDLRYGKGYINALRDALGKFE